MAKKRRRRRAAEAKSPTSDYRDSEGNVQDVWQRREEMLFERLVVSWEIAGLPLDDQKMLLGRYRMADPDTRRWVRETITGHVREFIPEIGL
jgi:hypothetical protein